MTVKFRCPSTCLKDFFLPDTSSQTQLFKQVTQGDKEIQWRREGLPIRSLLRTNHTLLNSHFSGAKLLNSNYSIYSSAQSSIISF